MNYTSKSNPRGIFAPVVALAFNSRQLDDLREFLLRRSENTEVVPISDVDQLLLSADGRLRENGYRFNFLGFQALCDSAARGLSALFNELSGVWQYRSQPRTLACDLAAAISVYNTTLRTRIEQLRERSLLVDNRERVVDGFLGLSHRMLDNSQFLSLVSAEMEEQRPTAQFHRAELIGRELRLLWVDPTTARKDIYSDSRHSLVAGWLFSNQEDRGKSIHAARCVVTRFGIAASRSTGSRLAHVGADLTGRTQVMVSQAIERDIDMAEIVAQIARLQAQPLGFVDSPDRFETTATNWTNKLCRLRVPRVDSRVIVRNAALVGADIDARDPVEAWSRDMLSSRTLYDLLCALLRYARAEPANSRDRLQEAAMDLLVPRKRKTDGTKKSKTT